MLVYQYLDLYAHRFTPPTEVISLTSVGYSGSSRSLGNVALFSRLETWWLHWVLDLLHNILLIVAVGFFYTITEHQAIRPWMEGAVPSPDQLHRQHRRPSWHHNCNTNSLRHQDDGPTEPGGMDLERQYDYGNGSLLCYRRRPPGRGFPNQGKTYLIPLVFKSLSPPVHLLLPHLSFHLFHLSAKAPSHPVVLSVLCHTPRSLTARPHRLLHPRLLRHPSQIKPTETTTTQRRTQILLRRTAIRTLRPNRSFYRRYTAQTGYTRRMQLFERVLRDPKRPLDGFTWRTARNWLTTIRDEEGVTTSNTYTFKPTDGSTLRATFRFPPYYIDRSRLLIATYWSPYGTLVTGASFVETKPT